MCQVPSVSARRCVVCGGREGLRQAEAFQPMVSRDAHGRRLYVPTVTLCEGCAGELEQGTLHFRWRLRDEFTYRAMVNGTAKRGYGCGRMEWLRTDEPMGQDEACDVEKGWERVMSWRK